MRRLTFKATNSLVAGKGDDDVVRPGGGLLVGVMLVLRRRLLVE